MCRLGSRRFVFGLLTALILVVNSSCSTHPTNETEIWEVLVQYPVHHYYSGPIEQRIFQLSPDGSKLASLEAFGDFINLVITDLVSGKRQLATNFNDVLVTGYTWANNKRLLFYTSDELGIYAVDIDAGNGRNWANTTVVCKDECLASEEPVFLVNYVQVLSRLPSEPDRVLVSSNHKNILQPSLYELDINTGHLFTVKAGGDHSEIYRWPIDGNGRILQAGLQTDAVAAILQFNTITSTWSEIPAEADTFKPIEHTNISRHLMQLKSELDVEDVRVTSIDDKGAKAVLMASSAQSSPDYYLYDFDDGSINLLDSSLAEVALIEANPSRIRVELIVVNDSYQRRSFDWVQPIIPHRNPTTSEQYPIRSTGKR